MEIIDFETKGNLIRLSMGNRESDYWGDDWADLPYEHNAGAVYDEFVQGYLDFCVDFETDVLEPCSGAFNSMYSKEDMKNRKVPCLIFVTQDLRKEREEYYDSTFDFWVKDPKSIKIYFNDDISVIHQLCKTQKGFHLLGEQNETN